MTKIPVGENDNRLELLDELVQLRKPVNEALQALSVYPFDFEGTPYQFNRSHLLEAIERANANQLGFDDLILWAEALEFRDDMIIVGHSEDEKDSILNAIFLLANPTLSDVNGFDLLKFLKTELAKT